MDFQQKKQLLEKYWKGETSPQEEAWLKKNIADLESEMSPSDFAYLNELNQYADLSMEESFKMEDIMEEEVKEAKVVSIPFYKNFRRIAVGVMLLIGVAFAGNQILNTQAEEIIVEQTPEEAFETAKQSLLLISQKLNKGIDCANEFGKFNKTRSKIETGG